MSDNKTHPLKLTAYTDGSCWTGDRIGGWGWVVIDHDGHIYDHGGSQSDTTISCMELYAMIDCLEFILDACGPSDIVVYSDSQYAILGITDRTRARKVNKDLWKALDYVTDAHSSVKYEHVRGHKGNLGNELADEIAGRARKERQEEDSRSTSGVGWPD